MGKLKKLLLSLFVLVFVQLNGSLAVIPHPNFNEKSFSLKPDPTLGGGGSRQLSFRQVSLPLGESPSLRKEFINVAEEYFSLVVRSQQNHRALHALWIGNINSLKTRQHELIDEFYVEEECAFENSTMLPELVKWIQAHHNPENGLSLLSDKYGVSEETMGLLQQEWERSFIKNPLITIDLRTLAHQTIAGSYRKNPKTIHTRKLDAIMRYLIHLHPDWINRFFAPSNQHAHFKKFVENQNFEQVHAFAWITNLFISQEPEVCYWITIFPGSLERDCHIGNQLYSGQWVTRCPRGAHCPRGKPTIADVHSVVIADIIPSEYGYEQAFCIGTYEFASSWPHSFYASLLDGKMRFYRERWENRHGFNPFYNDDDDD